MAKQKHAKAKHNPSLKKEPRTTLQTSPDSIMDKCPVWRLGHIDHEGDWGFDKLKKRQTLKSILIKLKGFENMKWREIEGDDSHLISVVKISSAAKKRLSEIGKDIYQDLFSFRFSGRNRLWGIRIREEFHILWWDPNHTVYPVKKKHT